jgi:flagellar motor switch/type III secretory pathway protein FliN
MTMEQYELLPIEIEVSVDATTLRLRQILDLRPGAVLPCARRADGLLAITAGGQLIGYGRLEEDSSCHVRLVKFAELMQ